MGCYSHVAIAFPEKKFEEFKLELLTLMSKTPEFKKEKELIEDLKWLVGEDITFRPADRIVKVRRHAEDFTVIEWRHVKWYKAFPSVTYMENYVREHQLPFVYIGEGNKDIEVLNGAYPFFFFVNHEFEY